MAAVDPIVYAQLCKLFPNLTILQVADVCLYSAGATYKDIGQLRAVSPETVKKSLEAAQKRLCISNLQSLKVAFLCRLLFRQALSISSISNLNKDDLDSFAVTSEEIEKLRMIHPRLSLVQATCVLYFVCGLDINKISDEVGKNLSEVESAMTDALTVLNVPSLHSLRVMVLSEFFIKLA